MKYSKSSDLIPDIGNQPNCKEKNCIKRSATQKVGKAKPINTATVVALSNKEPGLFAAFKMENLSIYASLFFFAFLYTPINMIVSVWGNFLSRRQEYEADAYVLAVYGKPRVFITALKKLSVDNLSNLTPHPLKVFLHYNHPPVLQRIRAISKTRFPK